jgi:hypothetical protein
VIYCPGFSDRVDRRISFSLRKSAIFSGCDRVSITVVQGYRVRNRCCDHIGQHSRLPYVACRGLFICSILCLGGTIHFGGSKVVIPCGREVPINRRRFFFRDVLVRGNVISSSRNVGHSNVVCQSDYGRNVIRRCSRERIGFRGLFGNCLISSRILVDGCRLNISNGLIRSIPLIYRGRFNHSIRNRCVRGVVDSFR